MLNPAPWDHRTGNTEHRLPRSSHSSSTRLVSAVAAPALCLGEGTSCSLSARHRTGENTAWLEAWDKLGRLWSQDTALKKSPYRASLVENMHWYHVVTPTPQGLESVQTVLESSATGLNTADIQSPPLVTLLVGFSPTPGTWLQGLKYTVFTTALST